MFALLLAASLAYVGNQACRPCHTKIYGSYSQTPMAQSCGRVQPGAVEPGRFRHGSSGTDYRIDANGLVYWRSPRGFGER